MVTDEQEILLEVPWDEFRRIVGPRQADDLVTRIKRDEARRIRDQKKAKT